MLSGDVLEIIGAVPGPTKALGRAIDVVTDTTRVVCSFDAETLVLSERGLVPIALIKPLQDRVWSTNEESGFSEWNLVLAQSIASYNHEVLVTIRDLEGGDEQTITSNRIHPYFARVPESESVNAASEEITYNGPIIGGRWIDAGDLKPGYLLLNNHGAWVEVISVEKRPRDLQAWNLTVAAAHSFYVAETVEDNPVWVHNSCVSANTLKHIFGNPRHGLDGLVAKLGSQQAVYEAVEKAANRRLGDIRQVADRNGIGPSAGITVNVGGSMVQLSGGRILSEVAQDGTITERFSISGFSTVVRMLP